MAKKKADDVEELETAVEETEPTPDAVDPVEADEADTDEAAEEIAAAEEVTETEPAEGVQAEDDESGLPPIVKVGGQTVRARGFFGSYKNARFRNDEADEWGVAERVSDETLALLRQDFPNLEIEVLG